MMRKYIDANIFVNSVLYNDERAHQCIKIISKIIKKEMIGITSVLTWDEFIYVIHKNLGKEIAIHEGEKFLKLPNLFFIDADKNIIMHAQKIMEEHNLKPRDAIHLASALSENISEIISDDSDFDKIKEIKRISPEHFKY
ncbi:MAG: PIN domain-containing protein [Nanoarchaeota archaeon]